MLDAESLRDFIEHRLPPDHPNYADLESRGFLHGLSEGGTLAPLLARIRTRKAFLFDGPPLHIFVVSLRCHHSCGYCQVSRQSEDAERYDLVSENVTLAIERLFEWPSPRLTIEFQGGEPLLAFDQIRNITNQVISRNRTHKKQLSFVVATTLHDLDEERLEFFRTRQFKLSTSLDGPRELHNFNRPIRGRNSYERTIEGIDSSRQKLGHDSVSALTTITKRSLSYPAQIVDEYVERGFHSIFLRPLSPYGFARKNSGRLDYSMGEFISFYKIAFDRILYHNRNGYRIDEAYASLILGHILTPFSHGYVDLRSPTGAGFGAIVYDFDGRVYPSDEARMLAAMGDDTFCLGTVKQPVTKWMSSPAMSKILGAAVAESIPGCSDCVFLPYCGSDPIDSYARQGDVVGHRPSSAFCSRHTGLFEFLFERWLSADREERQILRSWTGSQRARDPEPMAELA